MREVIGNEHAGQRLPRSSLYWIVFIYYFSRLEYNWSWTRILRGSSSSSSRSRDENGMCGASELQVVVVVFPFSLPISFAPFLRREVHESLLYPVVWAGRKAWGRLRATRRRRSKENHSTAFEPFFLLLLLLQSNNSTFSLLFFRCIYLFFFLSRLFGFFLSPSFLHLISLMPHLFLYADSLIQDHISLWYTHHVTTKTAGLYLPSKVSWFWLVKMWRDYVVEGNRRLTVGYLGLWSH